MVSRGTRVVALLAAATLTGCSPQGAAGQPAERAASTLPQTVAAGAVLSPGTERADAGAPAGVAPTDVPTRLAIPSIGVEAEVVTTTETGGVLRVPDDIQTVGWSDLSSEVNERGVTLIAGHLDNASGGEGALHDLADVDPGDMVTVFASEGTRAYRVTAVETYPKDRLPADIVDVSGPHRLAIVTCDPDRLARGTDGLLHAADNTVVWASPLGG